MKIRNGETPIKIPPIVKAGDPITARWANDLRDALQRLRDRVPVIKGASGGGGSRCLPFFNTYTKPAEGEGDPIDMLTGGIVTGGATNETVEDIELELLTPANEPKPNGTRLFLVVNFTAVTADDVLMPGVLSLGEITTEYVDPDADPPDNKIPENLDPTGTIYINLGEIRDGRFIAAKCGDKTIFHCPGSITVTP
jgi:hypothetical protein